MADYLIEHYGDIASVIGLAISIVGFVVTIIGVRKARWAAEEASRAAREAVSRVRTRTSTDEVGEILAIMRQADSACRRREWDRAAERCDESRARLARLSENDRLELEDRNAAINFLAVIGSLLNRIDELRTAESSKGLSAQRNKQFHEMITALAQIQGRLQSKSWEV